MKPHMGLRLRLVVESAILLAVITLFGPALLTSVKRGPQGASAGESGLRDASAPSTASNVTQETQLRQWEANQLHNLDEELNRLDADVSERRRSIEVWYAENLANCKSWAEKRKQELDREEKAAYLRSLQQMKNTESVTNRELRANGYTNSTAYVTRSGYVFGSGQSTIQGNETEQTNTRVVGDPAREYDQTMAQIKQARDAIQVSFTRLEAKKRELLNDLDSTYSRTKTTLNWRKDRVQRDTVRQLSGGPDLSISAIGVGEGNRFHAIIGDELVYEGDTISGYKIRKIYPDRIELEKNGRVKVQKVE